MRCPHDPRQPVSFTIRVVGDGPRVIGEGVVVHGRCPNARPDSAVWRTSHPIRRTLKPTSRIARRELRQWVGRTGQGPDGATPCREESVAHSDLVVVTRARVRELLHAEKSREADRRPGRGVEDEEVPVRVGDAGQLVRRECGRHTNLGLSDYRGNLICRGRTRRYRASGERCLGNGQDEIGVSRTRIVNADVPGRSAVKCTRGLEDDPGMRHACGCSNNI